MVTRASFPHVERMEVLALRGTRMAAVHWTSSDDGGNTADTLTVQEVRHGGLCIRSVFFEPPDRIMEAMALVDKWYVGSHDAVGREVVSVGSRTLAANHDPSRRDELLHLLPEDVVIRFADELASWGEVSRDDYLTIADTLTAEADHIAYWTVWFEPLSENFAFSVLRRTATMPDGTTPEWMFATAVETLDGQGRIADLFPIELLDRAHARARELNGLGAFGALPSALDDVTFIDHHDWNEAVRWRLRMLAFFNDLERDPSVQLFRDDARIEDRRPLFRSEFVGRDELRAYAAALLEGWEEQLSTGAVPRNPFRIVGVLDVAGDRLCLTAQFILGVIDNLHLIEVDDEGLLLRTATFEAEQLDEPRTALAESHAESTSTSTSDHPLDRYDFVVPELRRVVGGTPYGEMSHEQVRAWQGDGSVRRRLFGRDDLQLDDRRSVVNLGAATGSSERGGGRLRRGLHPVGRLRGARRPGNPTRCRPGHHRRRRWQRVRRAGRRRSRPGRPCSPGDLPRQRPRRRRPRSPRRVVLESDDAVGTEAVDPLDRITFIVPELRRFVEGTPYALLAVFIEAYANGDEDGLAWFYGRDDLVVENRMSTVNSGTHVGSDARAVLLVTAQHFPNPERSEILTVRGTRFGVSRWHVRRRRRQPIQMLAVQEAAENGQLIRQVLLDPDRIIEAVELLDEWYVSSPGAIGREVLNAGASMLHSIHDPARRSELLGRLADDLVVHMMDSVTLLGDLDRDGFLEVQDSLTNEAERVDYWTVWFEPAGDAVSCLLLRRVATMHDGSTAEWVHALVGRSADGQLRLADLTADQLDRAPARAAELADSDDGPATGTTSYRSFNPGWDERYGVSALSDHPLVNQRVGLGQGIAGQDTSRTIRPPADSSTVHHPWRPGSSAPAAPRPPAGLDHPFAAGQSTIRAAAGASHHGADRGDGADDIHGAGDGDGRGRVAEEAGQGLRPGELRLSADDEQVLRIVGPLLAQTLRARALASDLQESRAAAISTIEEERRRLRRDLHDGLGPTLSGIAHTAAAARNSITSDPGGADELLRRLRSDAATAVAEIRRLVYDMRPPALDELGLVAALRQQFSATRTPAGRPMHVVVEADDLPPLPASVEVAAYRIATEAVTNSARHSRTDHAWLQLRQDRDHLEVTVRDNGSSAGTWVPGVGLSSIRERASEVGGTVDITANGHGSEVRALLPLG